MYSNINIEKILFLDIETVPQYAEYKYLTDDIKHLWDRKAESLARYETYAEEPSPEYLYSRAGIYAEFGKIVCISVAYIRNNTLFTKSFYSDDEKEILSQFANLVNGYFNTKDHRLCGHNLKEFDVPYLCRRMLVNEITIPQTINSTGFRI